LGGLETLGKGPQAAISVNWPAEPEGGDRYE
jgi:hypothetical protein